MTNEMHYTIGELAELSGVTPRTIRYYTSEGLLMPPDTRGRVALYGEEHLNRLRLIARLKEAYLPLGEIKARLDQLTGEQVRQLLEEYAQAAPTPPSTSAADYIAQVLTTQAAPLFEQSAALLPRASLPAGAPPAPPAPAGYAAPPAPLPAAAQSIAPPAAAAAAPSSAPVAQPAAPAAQTAAPGGLLRRLIPQRRERAAPSATGESWQRVPLAPGVELHLREPAAPGMRERIERLVAFARELFAEQD